MSDYTGMTTPFQRKAAVEIKKLHKQVEDLEARCKKFRECMERAASMPGRDWLGGQLELARVLLEDDAIVADAVPSV